MVANYQSTARRVDALRGVATDPHEIDYWHGYRLGMIDSLPNADPDARAQREAAYTLTARSPARRDASRAVVALGYWDGRRWESRTVRDFYQRLTTAEWLEVYGEIYGVANARYVIQMCSGLTPTRGTEPARLPYPWLPEKAGRSWMIKITGESK